MFELAGGFECHSEFTGKGLGAQIVLALSVDNS
jgi:hypothetical protein